MDNPEEGEVLSAALRALCSLEEKDLASVDGPLGPPAVSFSVLKLPCPDHLCRSVPTNIRASWVGIGSKGDCEAFLVEASISRTAFFLGVWA